MADGFLLSENDRDAIRRLLAEYRPGRLATLSKQVAKMDSQSPEVYVALVPSGGINARDDLVPGTAGCEIYRISETGNLELAGFTQLAHNVSESEVEGDAYVLIERDKFGKWVIAGGVGGGDLGCGALLLECPVEPGTGEDVTLVHHYRYSWDETTCVMTETVQTLTFTNGMLTNVSGWS